MSRAATVTAFCTAGLAIAFLALLLGAPVALVLFGLAAGPLMFLFYYLLRQLANWANTCDSFSPLVAFPLAYVAWFIIGSIDIVRLPHFFGFGAFDPMPLRIPIYAAVGLVGYILGVLLCFRRLPRTEKREPDYFRFGFDRRTYGLALLGLSVVALGTYSYIAAHIGVPILSPDAGVARLELAKYHWFGTPFFAASYTIVLLLLGTMWIGPRRSLRDTWPIVCGVALISIVFLSMAGRAIVVPPLLTGTVLYHYLRRQIRLKVFVAMIAIVFALLSVFGYTRDLTVGDQAMTTMEEAGISRAVQPLVYCYLYIRYSVATLRDVSAEIPAHIPYQYGAITLRPFQSVLPGHHEMADFFFKEVLGNDFVGAGQPATIIGPFYADFGVLGIFGEMFLWGLLLTSLYRWMQRKRSLFSVMIFGWATQAGLFGIFGGVFTYLDTLMIPLCWLLLSFFISSYQPSSTPGEFRTQSGL